MRQHRNIPTVFNYSRIYAPCTADSTLTSSPLYSYRAQSFLIVVSLTFLRANAQGISSCGSDGHPEGELFRGKNFYRA